MAGNNLNKRAKMVLQASLPAVLEAKGWKLRFTDIPTNGFSLNAGEKRKVHMELQPGSEFTKADILGAVDRLISVDVLANGILMGGMSYYIDPDLKTVSGGKQPGGKTVPARRKTCLTV